MFDIGDDLHINLYPALIIIVIGCVISFFIRRQQMINTKKAFEAGICDEKFIKRCKSLKRFLSINASKDMSNYYCCLICDAYLKNNNTEEFFKEIQTIKNVMENTAYRLDLLLISYLNNKPLIKVMAEYKELIKDIEITSDLAVKKILETDFISETGRERAALLLKRVDNKYVIERLNKIMSNTD